VRAKFKDIYVNECLANTQPIVYLYISHCL